MAQGAQDAHRSSPYRYYALGLLTCVYVVNIIDRNLINIVAESIKTELKLSDSQLGLLTGLVFGAFYAAVSLPVARLAERRNRAVILSITLAIWSAFTTLCGVAQNFVQLALCRGAVGLGEGGYGSTAHSMISDYFPQSQRGRAFAVLGIAGPVGSLIGLWLGGVVTEMHGWRAAFFVLGLPGLALAVLLHFTLREPRHQDDRLRAMASEAPGMKQALATLASKPSFWLLHGGSAFAAAAHAGHNAFLAPFYLRNFPKELADLAALAGMQPLAFLGLTVGLVFGIGGFAGVLFGGMIADHLAAKRPGSTMLGATICQAVQIPLFIWGMLTSNLILSLVLVSATSFLTYTYFPALSASQQGIAPSSMRATSSSVTLMVGVFLGACGPLIVGIGSDLLSHHLNLVSGEGLRWAMILICVFSLMTVVLWGRTMTTLVRDFVE